VRDAWLEAEGFTVLRFWNSEVDGNLEGVMRVVLDVLESPPPHAGEGRRVTVGGFSNEKAGRQ